jgi:hypothetical protein
MEPINSDLFPPIPPETASAARIFFTPRNFYLAVGDRTNQLFTGIHLDNPFGVPQEAERNLAMLFLITIFQFIEAIPDWQAQEALRRRVDWKYALHLRLDYAGMELSSLCEFRRWFLFEQNHRTILSLLFSRLSGFLVEAKKQLNSLETSEIAQDVCFLNRVAIAVHAMRSVLEMLAAQNPDWLQTIALPHWYALYSVEPTKTVFAEGRSELGVLFKTIGTDGVYLLNQLTASGQHAVTSLPEVSQLKLVWQAQYNAPDQYSASKENICTGCPFMP